MTALDHLRKLTDAVSPIPGELCPACKYPLEGAKESHVFGCSWVVAKAFVERDEQGPQERCRIVAATGDEVHRIEWTCPWGCKGDKKLTWN